MRGHQALIALRQRRKVPGLVFVDLVADHSPVASDWQQRATQAHIEIADTEPIGRLDLRFLVELHVMASGFDAGRVEQLHAACLAAGAKRVTSSVLGMVGEEVRAVSVRDSKAEKEHGRVPA